MITLTETDEKNTLDYIHDVKEEILKLGCAGKVTLSQASELFEVINHNLDNPDGVGMLMTGVNIFTTKKEAT